MADVSAAPRYKLPESVLVVVHTPDLQVLVMERARHPGYWQSVTGSLEPGETPRQTCLREVAEETGLDATAYALRDWRLCNRFEIFAQWRDRYPPGVTHNIEHVFSLEVPGCLPVTPAPDEHRATQWLPWREAVGRCFSWTNRDAIRLLAGERGE